MDEKQFVDQFRYFCCHCDRKFIYEEVMNLHKEAMHSKPSEVESNDRPYSKLNKSKICPHCGKTYTGGDSFGHHIKNVHIRKNANMLIMSL